MGSANCFFKYYKKCFIFLMFFSSCLLYPKSISDIKKKSVLTVCSQAGFLPFEMKSVNGKWQGFDIELMKDFSKFCQEELPKYNKSYECIFVGTE